MDSPKESKKSKKNKKNKKEDKDNPYMLSDQKPAVVVKKFLDEPDGDDSPKGGQSKSGRTDADDALDIDISAPLRKDEILKEIKEYKMMTAEDVEREQRAEER